jgi:hypothetical protein
MPEYAPLRFSSAAAMPVVVAFSALLEKVP